MKWEKICCGIMWTVVAAIALWLLPGCAAGQSLPDDPLVFRQGVAQDYAYLTQGEKTYVPYCPMEQELLGECIGYCDHPGDDSGEPFRTYLYTLKGYPGDQWIVEVLDQNCSEGMILREESVTKIPEGLSSEYEWNRS